MENWERKMEKDLALEHSFNDSCVRSETDEELRPAVEASRKGQCFYVLAGNLSDDTMIGRGSVKVSAKRTLDAAAVYARQGMKTAILHFASPYGRAGHGCRSSLTQEQSLCRESTLCACLDTDDYVSNFCRAPYDTAAHMEDYHIAYTPDIVVFKEYDPKAPDWHPPVDTEREDWFRVDAISCIAPVRKWMKTKDADDEKMLKAFEGRFEIIIRQAAAHGVKALILGAFGCGGLENDPVIVATAAAKVLDKYRRWFDVVEFAIYGNKKNFRMFRMVLDRYLSAEG